MDVVADGTVDAVVNTVTGDRATLQDGFAIRRAAVERRIPVFTSLDTARSAAESLVNGVGDFAVRPIHEYREAPEPSRATGWSASSRVRTSSMIACVWKGCVKSAYGGAFGLQPTFSSRSTSSSRPGRSR